MMRARQTNDFKMLFSSGSTHLQFPQSRQQDVSTLSHQSDEILALDLLQHCSQYDQTNLVPHECVKDAIRLWCTKHFMSDMST